MGVVQCIYMAKTMQRHTKWAVVRKRPNQAETNCFTAGKKSFRLKVYPDGNVYRQSWERAAWLRGYRLAEREFNEEIRRSRAIEATLPIEA
jgi:hypothetical protein